MPETALVSDTLDPAPPDSVHLSGLLGTRFDNNRANRLNQLDETVMLSGFQVRPGSHPWIGEHVGKWMHAASLTCKNTNDLLLRQKLDRVASSLMACQGEDGYLGTYTNDKRWTCLPDTSWDVWVHYYNLIGLLAYHQLTGNPKALESACRIGDLLCLTFGPSALNINYTAGHMGTPATAVMEGMALLYRATGQQKYLDFANYCVQAYELPPYSHLLRDFTNSCPANQVASGKAYEQTVNLCALLELYRITGSQQFLTACKNAWNDIASKRLYITGGGSVSERWSADNVFPNFVKDSPCETCVSVTWIQFNMQLLRLTGEAKYADEIERCLYNHLLGAQTPSGEGWCYYSGLEGQAKPYSGIDNFTCCASSGQRAVALLPSIVYMTSGEGIAVNLYTPSNATLDAGGCQVDIIQTTSYPAGAEIALTVNPRTEPSSFKLMLRIPKWANGAQVMVNGQLWSESPVPGTYYAVDRLWRSGDIVTLNLPPNPRLVEGTGGNLGKAAAMYGPLVLALDTKLNAPLRTIDNLIWKSERTGGIDITLVDASPNVQRPVFETDGVMLKPYSSQDVRMKLTSFYAAGSTGSTFKTWIPLRGPYAGSLFVGGNEARSYPGFSTGSISDGFDDSICDTYTGRPSAESWFQVTVDDPVLIDTVEYVHGRTFPGGGWFDSSVHKPKISVLTEKNGSWIEVAELSSYPATTSTDPGTLTLHNPFRANFPRMLTYGIRIAGVPAGGNSPGAPFATCGELKGLYSRRQTRQPVCATPGHTLDYPVGEYVVISDLVVTASKEDTGGLYFAESLDRSSAIAFESDLVLARGTRINLSGEITKSSDEQKYLENTVVECPNSPSTDIRPFSLRCSAMASATLCCPLVDHSPLGPGMLIRSAGVITACDISNVQGWLSFYDGSVLPDKSIPYDQDGNMGIRVLARCLKDSGAEVGDAVTVTGIVTFPTVDGVVKPVVIARDSSDIIVGKMPH